MRYGLEYVAVLFLDRVIPDAVLDLVAGAVKRDFLPDSVGYCIIVKKQEFYDKKSMRSIGKRCLNYASRAATTGVYSLIKFFLGHFHVFEVLVDCRVVQDGIVDP